MRNSKLVYFIAGALVAEISSVVTHTLEHRPRIPKGSQVNLTPEDYIEIHQLISMYPRDVDPGAVRDATWMFTEDARSVISGSPMLKPEDFKDFYGGLVAADGQAKQGGVRHFNSSYVIVGLPDGTARGIVIHDGGHEARRGRTPRSEPVRQVRRLVRKDAGGVADEGAHLALRQLRRLLPGGVRVPDP